MSEEQLLGELNALGGKAKEVMEELTKIIDKATMARIQADSVRARAISMIAQIQLSYTLNNPVGELND